MDIVKTIVEFFKKPVQEHVNESPARVCSLCWGYQEYDGKIRRIYKDRQVEVNNHRDSYMLIQNFVKEHVDGYQIKDGVVHVCPNCSEFEEGKDRIKKFDPFEK